MSGCRLDRLALMVVDDNRHMSRLLVQILRGLNIRDVVVIADPVKAVEEFQVRPVDLILTEHVLQPINGVEFVRRIRADTKSPDPFVPVIMLTAYSYADTVLTARDIGVTEFLAKPISARSLYLRILETIDRPRPFIRTDGFFGPDRRRRTEDPKGGDNRHTAPEETSVEGAQLIPARAAGE